MEFTRSDMEYYSRRIGPDGITIYGAAEEWSISTKEASALLRTMRRWGYVRSKPTKVKGRSRSIDLYYAGRWC